MRWWEAEKPRFQVNLLSSMSESLIFFMLHHSIMP